jgi:hypothetical protein
VAVGGVAKEKLDLNAGIDWTEQSIIFNSKPVTVKHNF